MAEKQNIFIVWWMPDKGDSPKIEVFANQNKAYDCWKEHKHKAFKCDMECHSISPERTIGYQECSDAMLKMWMANVLTDGEYNRIMGRLNRAHGEGEL